MIAIQLALYCLLFTGMVRYATGADSCDYWYVPDESDIARLYTGRIV